jgi:hypothetical protein
MLFRVGIAALYFFVSFIVFLLWTQHAQTEAHQSFPSLVRQQDGTAGKPFVRRRLVADGAWLLASVVPESWWRQLAVFAEGDSLASQWTAKMFRHLEWAPEHYPVLISGYSLIALATLGCLVLFRTLLAQYYIAPSGMLHAAALTLGVAILGGNGRWNSYPYDIPNLFAVLLALVAIKTYSWWTAPAFAVAAYSKETSILLLFAYVIMHWQEKKNVRFWAELALMSGVFLSLRLWIEIRFPGPEGHWWFPERNAKVLFWTVFHGSWLLIPASVVFYRLFQMRPNLPIDALIVVSGMAVVIVGMGFFKGWIEERRAYLELLPLAGVVLFRWAVEEAGLGDRVSLVGRQNLEF